MSLDERPIRTLLAKEEIRELALLYCRGVDRKDYNLLRTLYTRDGTDTHGRHFDGPAGEYVDFLAGALTTARIGAHYLCNHLIEVDGETAQGEVYALGFHQMPDGNGGMREEFVGVRYLDHYRREDGRWRFASREVMFDLEHDRPIAGLPPAPDGVEDPSYRVLSGRLFSRG
ncbi:nuclear transport factor 2 family protein [Parahaliea maris]|uniref:Nuclear transport factor 2 family protein n=1 Tax=Parahaliea maris TaxID=2716870 RepID=A0A5C9A9A1_9GAMM|nr:nuclear transport factor 2 family protein [Parahaliea maris]TXS96157.1 nuclear transport factor 2 family protein [Parahaliea maris]